MAPQNTVLRSDGRNLLSSSVPAPARGLAGLPSPTGVTVLLTSLLEAKANWSPGHLLSEGLGQLTEEGSEQHQSIPALCGQREGNPSDGPSSQVSCPERESSCRGPLRCPPGSGPTRIPEFWLMARGPALGESCCLLSMTSGNGTECLFFR